MSVERPLYEKRSWGEYWVLHYEESAPGKARLTKRLRILAGCNISYQYHQHRQEIWQIEGGQGCFLLDGVLSTVVPGATLHIPVGAKHSIRAEGEDLVIYEEQEGYPLVEEDIVRLAVTWEEITGLTERKGCS
ncbi:MAG: phosphomannose isomerase type II C-terminal cupin domain [Symbiobacteriaceae bacterium]|nr:phosphomannose isomerase type II C-terminal cupin domain [Symbiobacteriaceae bacterium]